MTDWKIVAEKGIPIIQQQVKRIGGPITLRRIFYLFYSARLIENKETHYQRLSQVSSKWRKSGLLNWRYITDDTREMIHPPIYPVEWLEIPNPEDFMNDPTEEQDNYVEVWVEKAGNIPILQPICRKYFVPLVNTHGHVSDTFKYQLAERLREQDKPCYIIYISDLDAEGEHMPVHLKSWLEEFGDVQAHINKIILTHEQVDRYSLPQQYKSYAGTSRKQHVKDFITKYGHIQVEIDSLDIDTIQNILDTHLSGLVDIDTIERVKQDSIIQANEKLSKLYESVRGD